MFDINGKVALITGGASGIGLLIAKVLLRNGLKACTLADINEKYGKDALEMINHEFGENKAIFVKTDVVNKIQFEDAFNKTIEKFKNVDILINNAGVLDDAAWERTIEVNIQGVINGMLLGMENYLQRYKSGSEGVILNLSSISGIDALSCFPIYSCTKFAAVGLTRSFGAEQHYNRTKVKVICVCPGITQTPLITGTKKKTLGDAYHSRISADVQDKPIQSSEFLSETLPLVIKEGETGSVWVIEGSQPPYEITFPTRQERRKS